LEPRTYMKQSCVYQNKSYMYKVQNISVTYLDLNI